MAANIATDANGNVMMASLRQNPWHNSGTVFQEEVTGQEMLKVAHLDWDVIETDVYADCGIMTNVPAKAVGWDSVGDKPIMSEEKNVLDNFTQRKIQGIKAVYRSDTGMPLGVPGEKFKVFQNSEMINLFEGLANGHRIIYETAGALDVGQTVWVMARIPDLKLDIGGDELNTYMFISNGHIGNRTLTVAPSLTRIVCQNTLSAATKEFRNRVSKNNGRKNTNTGYAIRHTTNMHLAVKEVEQAYASLLTDFALTKEMFEAMMKTPVTVDMKNRFFDFILDPTKEGEETTKELTKRGETRRSNKKDELEALYESPTNQTPASKDTVWGLYNCVTENVDHTRQTRCGADKEENSCRFESAMFGSGKDLKDLAFVKAMELVNA